MLRKARHWMVLVWGRLRVVLMLCLGRALGQVRNRQAVVTRRLGVMLMIRRRRRKHTGVLLGPRRSIAEFIKSVLMVHPRFCSVSSSPSPAKRTFNLPKAGERSPLSLAVAVEVGRSLGRAKRSPWLACCRIHV